MNSMSNLEFRIKMLEQVQLEQNNKITILEGSVTLLESQKMCDNSEKRNVDSTDHTWDFSCGQQIEEDSEIGKWVLQKLENGDYLPIVEEHDKLENNNTILDATNKENNLEQRK